MPNIILKKHLSMISPRVLGDEPPGSPSSKFPSPASASSPPPLAVPPLSDSDLQTAASPSKTVWTKKQGKTTHPVIVVVDGVASMKIPDEIFEDPNPLWKSFVVGYFMGDAPHVGSIHATVNRIWSTPRSGSRIDVQFIEKKTVLFRIDNP